jgi:hypothetical protein
VKLEVVPITYKVFKKKKSLVSITHWACWKVARTDVKSQKRDKVQPVQAFLSEAASLLAGMYMAEADDENDSDGMEGWRLIFFCI